jgi:four helix bundle protein
MSNEVAPQADVPGRGGGPRRSQGGRGASGATYDLQDRLLKFTSRVIDVVEALPGTRVGNHIGGQLIRCGTSPLASYGEAQAAESRADFVHKLKVALKELREVRAWLLLVQQRSLAGPVARLRPLVQECDELISIFFASIRTAQRRQKG